MSRCPAAHPAHRTSCCDCRNDEWLVVLKTLMVLHRLMRETDASFVEDINLYMDKTRQRGALSLDNFKDTTSMEARHSTPGGDEWPCLLLLRSPRGSRRVSPAVLRLLISLPRAEQAWDFSAFIRVYSRYLDERCEVARAPLQYDPEHEGGSSKATPLRSMSGAELLENMPKARTTRL